jgi:hypothetical protein
LLERFLLSTHLVLCGGCRAFDRELRSLTGALRSTALSGPPAVASSFGLRVLWQPQRLALAGGLAVAAMTMMMSGLVRETPGPEVGALSPVQGLPVYSTPYRLEGLPVYNRPAALLRTLAS